MKKLAAILLMMVFMFNLFGYKLWVYYATQQADKQLDAKLENYQYDDAGLFIIKKAIQLPYYNNTTAYTTAAGEVEVNGVYYRFVKYRIYNNMLEMLCIPNAGKTKIKKEKDDYFNIVAGIEKGAPQKNKQGNSPTLKKMFSDFEVYNTPLIQHPAFTSQALKAVAVLLTGQLYHRTIEQPPDVVFALV